MAEIAPRYTPQEAIIESQSGACFVLMPRDPGLSYGIDIPSFIKKKSSMAT